MHTRPPTGRLRRPATVLAATLLLAVAPFAGCARTSIADAVTTTTTSTTTGDSTDATATEVQLVGDATTTTSTTTTTSPVTIADLEELEVASGIEGATAGSCVTVTYTPDTASTEQVGDLCIPEGRTSDTVVLLVHGGGGISGSREELAAWQEWYSAQGYVTFNIDYRIAEVGVDDGVYPEPEQDVKAAVQFLHLASPTLGTSSVVLQGHSAGARLGGIVLTTAGDATFLGDEMWTSASDAVDGFIGLYGYYDGFQFEWPTYYGGDGTEGAGADAVAQVASASAPALLVHGTDDALVDAEQSEVFSTALSAAGQDVALVLLDGLLHGFDLTGHGELSDAGVVVAARIDAWIDTNDE